jgi:hypothetical protein
MSALVGAEVLRFLGAFGDKGGEVRRQSVAICAARRLPGVFLIGLFATGP